MSMPYPFPTLRSCPVVGRLAALSMVIAAVMSYPVMAQPPMVGPGVGIVLQRVDYFHDELGEDGVFTVFDSVSAGGGFNGVSGSAVLPALIAPSGTCGVSATAFVANSGVGSFSGALSAQRNALNYGGVSFVSAEYTLHFVVCEPRLFSIGAGPSCAPASGAGITVFAYLTGEGNTSAGFMEEATGEISRSIWLPAGGYNLRVGALLSAGELNPSAACTFEFSFSGLDTAASCDPADTDGDGLLDEWERVDGGIDGDGDGLVDLSLYALGARADHKDLFLEIDSMAGLSMTAAAAEQVRAAFAAAPVMNIDHTPGVRLHLLLDETDLPFAAVTPQATNQ